MKYAILAKLRRESKGADTLAYSYKGGYLYLCAAADIPRGAIDA
jgi:hypothetical protein